jgi:hypothetical protein
LVSSDALSRENAEELLTQLLGWYAQSLSQQNAGIVARKLSSAISTFFVHFHENWPQILRHITQSFTNYLRNGAPHQGTHFITIRAATWVLTSILEDCAKKDLNSPSKFVLPCSSPQTVPQLTPYSLSLYTSVLGNTGDATELLAESLKDGEVPDSLLEDALKCLQVSRTRVWKAQQQQTN